MAGQGHKGLLGLAILGVTRDWEAQFPPGALVSPWLGGGAAGSTAAVEAKAVTLI